MLDFHYSDWWADPQKQNRPAAWAKLDFDALEKQTETRSPVECWPGAQVKVPRSTVRVFAGDVKVIAPPEPYGDNKQWGHLIRLLNADVRKGHVA